MLKNHVYLLQFRIVNDLEQANDVRMPHFLQDGNLSLCLVFWGDRHLTKPPLLREPLYDLDSDIFARFKAPSQLNFTMNASTYLIDNFVLIDQFAAGDEILFDLCLMRPKVALAY